MSELSTPAITLIGIIALAVAVPKYVKLPESLELLFQDRLGQVLLLGLAAVIGSYNFAVGLMLAVFFMSLMVNTNSVEGFDNQEEPEDLENEDDLAAMNNNNPVDSSLDVIDEMPDDEDVKDDFKDEEDNALTNEEDNVQLPKSTRSVTPKNTKNTRKTTSNDDENMCKLLDSQIKSNQSQIKELKNHMMKLNCNSKEEFKEDLEEGFGCGCQGLDNRRRKLKYLEETGEIEGFQSQPLVQGQSDFDVVACRYDLKQTGFNEDINGPPLSSCNTYQAVNLEETGTVFYPLNA